MSGFEMIVLCILAYCVGYWCITFKEVVSL